MATTEISQERNNAWRRWKATAIEWLSVIIACTSLLFMVLVGGLSLWVASRADAKVDYELMSTRVELQKHTRHKELMTAYVMELRARMEAAGIETPPLPEDE